MPPMIVIILIVLEPVQIIAQDRSIAGRQAIVIRRFSDRINDIVQRSIIELTVIELRLQFRQFMFRPLETVTFPVARVSSTPDMVKIRPYLYEHLGPPALASVPLITVVVPVLRQGTRPDESRYYQPCFNHLLHRYNSPLLMGRIVQARRIAVNWR